MEGKFRERRERLQRFKEEKLLKTQTEESIIQVQTVERQTEVNVEVKEEEDVEENKSIEEPKQKQIFGLNTFAPPGFSVPQQHQRPSTICKLYLNTRVYNIQYNSIGGKKDYS